jgi:membrane associated rhomboid family serine protease
MTPSPVGMRCPECGGNRQKVVKVRAQSTRPQVTLALIAINVLVYVAAGQFSLENSPLSSVMAHGALFAPNIAVDHQYYRILTSGFLHWNVIHIGFNMLVLYQLGLMLENGVGSVKFAVVYFVALFAGSLGALIATPNTVSAGASGAIFGLMGMAVVELRVRGLSLTQSGIAGLIVINIIISVTVPGISLADHLGGLIGGALAAYVLHEATRRRQLRWGYVACALIAAACVFGSIEAADHAPKSVFAPLAAVHAPATASAPGIGPHSG